MRAGKLESPVGVIPSTNKNVIINGALDIWQRGTTTLTNPVTATYFPDRFRFAHALGDGTYNTICCAETPVAGFPYSYSLQVDCTHIETAVAAKEYTAIVYSVEGYDFKRLTGQQCTLSFWVKATKTGTYCIAFINYAYNKSYVAEYTINSSNTWERKTITLTFNAGGTWNYTNDIGLMIWWSIFCGSDYQTTPNSWQDANKLATSNQVNGFDSVDNNFYLTGVQLELGPVATDFEFRPYATELSLCKRYYQRIILTARGYCEDATYATGGPVSWETMRVSPTWSRIAGPTTSSNLYSGSPYGVLSVNSASDGAFFVQAAAAGDTYIYQVTYESTNAEL